LPESALRSHTALGRRRTVAGFR